MAKPQFIGKALEEALIKVAEKTFDGQKSEQYRQCSSEIADLVIRKQAAYGDSFGKSGQIMRILYPDGIKLDQMDDALTIVRMLDKLFRIATDKNAMRESPFKDLMGYALLAAVRDGYKCADIERVKITLPDNLHDLMDKTARDEMKHEQVNYGAVFTLKKYVGPGVIRKAKKPLSKAQGSTKRRKNV